MQYHLFMCRHALRVYKTYADKYGVFTPIERVKKPEPGGQDRVVEYAALPGLVFVDWRKSGEFRRRMSEEYQVKQMYSHADLAYTVASHELAEMQLALNREFDNAGAERWYDFEKGDDVEVHCPALPKFIGEVVKFRRNGNVRLRTQWRYVEIHGKWLRKV
jgi:transcription antitermination factor NusG